MRARTKCVRERSACARGEPVEVSAWKRGRGSERVEASAWKRARGSERVEACAWKARA